MLFFRFLWKNKNCDFEMWDFILNECIFRVEFKLFPVGWMRMVMVTQKHISEFVVSAKSSIINSPRTIFFWEKVLFLLAHVYEFQIQIQKKILSHFLCHTETRLPIFFFWQIFVGTIFMYVLSFFFFCFLNWGNGCCRIEWIDLVLCSIRDNIPLITNYFLSCSENRICLNFFSNMRLFLHRTKTVTIKKWFFFCLKCYSFWFFFCLFLIWIVIEFYGILWSFFVNGNFPTKIWVVCNGGHVHIETGNAFYKKKEIYPR